MKMYYLLVILLIVALAASCAKQGVGTLEGKVNIGPLCPVERNPPEPRCQPNAETYNSWPIAVFSADKHKLIAPLPINADGTYRLQLPTGSYAVDLQRKVGIGGSNLPLQFIITSGETTVLDINIDTGIR
jgi:hypothetical protein